MGGREIDGPDAISVIIAYATLGHRMEGRRVLVLVLILPGHVMMNRRAINRSMASAFRHVRTPSVTHRPERPLVRSSRLNRVRQTDSRHDLDQDHVPASGVVVLLWTTRRIPIQIVRSRTPVSHGSKLLR